MKIIFSWFNQLAWRTKYKVSILFFSCGTVSSCGQEKPADKVTLETTSTQPFHQTIDTTHIDSFFADFPLFSRQKNAVVNRYKKNNCFIWFDNRGLVEFGGVLYNKAVNMQEEGVAVQFPYRSQIEAVIFSEVAKPTQESELLLSSLYFFYTDHVLTGLTKEQSAKTNWYLPRDDRSFDSLLDSLLTNPGILKDGRRPLMDQYYNLRLALRKYRTIEKAGGWEAISDLPKNKQLKPGDTSAIVQQVRNRLFTEGYIAENSESNLFDEPLSKGIIAYHSRHHRESAGNIDAVLINELNIPVAHRIKTIAVNMERCRWISPSIANARELIAVNIPSFRVHYIRDRKLYFTSKVIVGREITNTVVFSGQLSHIVFSPYWNVPNSILEKEIKPAIRKNPNYLAQHNMEWHNGRVRQRPGIQNSLGLVKFMFPNSNNIYLHDTPAKSLFAKDDRAFSHGCIRVEKARDLAVLLMEKEAGWTAEKVDSKMNAGRESTYNLKQPIPVYIAYFTAWADSDGNVAFFRDVYDRDQRLMEMLHY